MFIRLLIIFTVVGGITYAEIFNHTHTYLTNKPSKLTLCDFTSGNLLDLSPQDMKKIISMGGFVLERIEHGKAAIVTSKVHDYGLSRMFQVFSEIDNFPLEIEVFRDMKSARKWLITNK